MAIAVVERCRCAVLLLNGADLIDALLHYDSHFLVHGRRVVSFDYIRIQPKPTNRLCNSSGEIRAENVGFAILYPFK